MDNNNNNNNENNENLNESQFIHIPDDVLIGSGKYISKILSFSQHLSNTI